MIDIYAKIMCLLKINITPYIYILIFLVGFQGAQAQDQTLQIKLNSTENQDLLSLEKSMKIAAEKDTLDQEVNSFVKKIELMGYLSSRLDSLVNKDSLWIAYIDPGSRVNYINIHYHQIPETILSQKELKPYSEELTDKTIRIPFSELSKFMQSLVDLFEAKGNSFVQFSLDDIELTTPC